ncbi:MAG: type IV toxin-antitoxin system AbiEi family antitoxin domain-containing protein [Propionibacteriaceae bacterium]|nr:type IV toxin-antitoxin system AbiEi family antitoxin domain-containing protein [Propionibacteriaceae bacterium]
MTIRTDLWDVAVEHYGYVTTQDARNLGIVPLELTKLASRGALERVSQGVYRFPQWPVGANDHLMEAVLWTRDPRAALSHDTALLVYELCNINPDKTHVTIPRREKKLRRASEPPALVIHYQDLDASQIGWWEFIPTVTVATAIDQCIASRVRLDLVLQAINTARRQGRIDEATAECQRHNLRNPRQ